MSRYIDADAFEVFGYTTQDGSFDDGVQFVLEKIDEQPTVEVVEVVHGEWQEKEIIDADHVDWQSARCSVCRKYHTTPYLYYFDNFNYCPNCGAKMDGEK